MSTNLTSSSATCLQFVDRKVEGLLNNSLIQEDFDVERALMEEAGYSDVEEQERGISKSFSFSFFSFLTERLYRKCLKIGKIINSAYLIKILPKEAGLSYANVSHLKEETIQEIYPSVFLHKDVFLKVIEALNLTKTKKAYINWLIVDYDDDDIDKERYLGKSEIEKWKDQQAIINIFVKEYEEKLKNEPRIIKCIPFS